MPDIKYSVTLSTGEKVTLDENQFNERQEKLFKADPDASAIRVSSYVPDDDDHDSVDSLFDYYTSYSNELLYSNASRFLRDVNNDEEEYIKTLSLFLKN